jgi:ABC-2 type transport system permease protein
LTILRTLTAKEIRALFASPIAYAVVAVFLLLNGYSFVMTLVVSKQATLIHIFFQSATQLVLLVPLVTMRLFAEERRGGTLELLLSSPAPEIEIVLAKFAAAMVLLMTMVGLTASYALVLGLFGTPDWGPVYSGYLGLVLLAGALVSLGLAISALTSNQIVAAAATLGLFGVLWSIDSLAAVLPAPIDNWFIGLSLIGRFTPFAVGAMYTSDAGFFLSVILLGLFLTVRALVRR